MPSTARVTTLDLSPRLVECGRERTERAGVQVEWVVGDAAALPFANHSLDALSRQRPATAQALRLRWDTLRNRPAAPGSRRARENPASPSPSSWLQSRFSNPEIFSASPVSAWEAGMAHTCLRPSTTE